MKITTNPIDLLTAEAARYAEARTREDGTPRIVWQRGPVFMVRTADQEGPDGAEAVYQSGAKH